MCVKLQSSSFSESIKNSISRIETHIIVNQSKQTNKQYGTWLKAQIIIKSIINTKSKISAQMQHEKSFAFIETFMKKNELPIYYASK